VIEIRRKKISTIQYESKYANTKTISRMLSQYKELPISLRSRRTSVFTSDFASHVNIS
jgi:hypothetical protein